MEKTVLIIDDHPLFRRALTDVVNTLNSPCRAIAAASAEEGVRYAREGEIDLVLLDLGLPGSHGVDVIAALRKASPATIVVVSASEHRQEVSAAMRAGAAAAISKGVSMETLREAVEQALAGTLPPQKWMRPAGSLSVSEDNGRGLTPRQQEVATLLMNGHSNKEIGMHLGLAEITVKTHLTAIFRLLGVVNRTQAVMAIRRLGLETAQG